MTGLEVLSLNLNVNPGVFRESRTVSAGRGVRPQSVTTSWQSVTRSQGCPANIFQILSNITKYSIDWSMIFLWTQVTPMLQWWCGDFALYLCSLYFPDTFSPVQCSDPEISWRDSLQMAGGGPVKSELFKKDRKLCDPPAPRWLELNMFCTTCSPVSPVRDGDLILEKCPPLTARCSLL